MKKISFISLIFLIVLTACSNVFGSDVENLSEKYGVVTIYSAPT